jgi:hypothetical protein
MRVVGIVLLWLAIIAALWLTVASGMFLWLAGLWDNPRIVWWSRPWQWLTYLMHGDGSWSEDIYLVASAMVATAPLLIYGRFVSFHRFGGIFGLGQQSLYGETGWNTPRELRGNGIRLKRKPF